MQHVLLVWLVGCCWISGSQALAHETLSRFLEHRAIVSAGPRNIDLQLDITFYHPRSAHERQRMDLNHDGTIDEHEIQVYLDVLQQTLDKKLSLQIDQTLVPLIPLYEPELLMNRPRTDEVGSQVLRLYMFARTPGDLKPGSRILLEDRLWLDEPAILTVSVEGTGGLQLEAENDAPPLSPPHLDGSARIVVIRCLTVPADMHSREADNRPRSDQESACLLRTVASRAVLPVILILVLLCPAIALIRSRHVSPGGRQ